MCALQIDHSQVNLLVIYRESLPLSLPEKIADLPESQPSRDRLRDWLPWVLTAAVAFVLLYPLGGAAHFEPDEGRNAEKAREILLLNDRVTPHENFHPVFDKPIFFYWLSAFSYQLFGVSEWAARIPIVIVGGRLSVFSLPFCSVLLGRVDSIVEWQRLTNMFWYQTVEMR